MCCDVKTDILEGNANNRPNYDSTVGVTILMNVAVTAERIVCQMWCLDMCRCGQRRRRVCCIRPTSIFMTCQHSTSVLIKSILLRIYIGASGPVRCWPGAVFRDTRNLQLSPVMYG